MHAAQPNRNEPGPLFQIQLGEGKETFKVEALHTQQPGRGPTGDLAADNRRSANEGNYHPPQIANLQGA